MNGMYINLLLDYLYNRFAVTFCMCFIGALCSEISNAINKRTGIDIKKVLISALFGTVLMCAAADYFRIDSFSIYVVMCFAIGVWGYSIFSQVRNSNVAFIFIKNLFKTLKDPISKSLSKTVEELEHTKTNKDPDDVEKGDEESTNEEEDEIEETQDKD